jgi:hypothetical protein
VSVVQRVSFGVCSVSVVHTVYTRGVSVRQDLQRHERHIGMNSIRAIAAIAPTPAEKEDKGL